MPHLRSQHLTDHLYLQTLHSHNSHNTTTVELHPFRTAILTTLGCEESLDDSVLPAKDHQVDLFSECVLFITLGQHFTVPLITGHHLLLAQVDSHTGEFKYNREDDQAE